ncbi:hypothetical protein ROZALSC1DRAFT_28361 [Rozella allomycis CSF55]|uniref:Uncharacterized protein n=1 Tax=Rozella allomycis (strain CSF55) TaxID=988480 RepID=A0A075B436_ROZAC|nr:hypothetical protein O9G_004808 [Rozella allomycis CSF55]RKP20127.1 hypothetical protein ROZALSC1DRAFT_28361 [Rozella allomycis CSF55]|eukprot:EPZ35989.1 hypothetical protein O9G_004808 [Rozella allomycis CSF55]
MDTNGLQNLKENEFTRYLDLKREEKQQVLEFVREDFDRVKKAFAESKKSIDKKHQERMQLECQLTEINSKIKDAEEVVSKLSMVKIKREENLAEIRRLEQEIEETNKMHMIDMKERQKMMMDERMELFKATESTLTRIREEAEQENERLEFELENCSKESQRQLKIKEHLESQNKALLREKEIKTSIIDAHLRRINANKS